MIRNTHIHTYAVILIGLCAGWTLKAQGVTVRPGDDIATAVEKVVRAGGGEVYIAPGRHKVSSTIELGDNVVLRGAGPASVLVAETSMDEYFTKQNSFGDETDVSILFNPRYGHGAVITNRDAAGNNNIMIRDVCIETDRDNVRLATGILLAGVEDAVIERVKVTDCGASGVTLLECRYISVRGVTVVRCHSGVFIRGYKSTTDHLRVTESTLRDNRWSGVYISKGGKFGTGKLADGPEDIIISRNYLINHMCDAAIKCHGARYVIIEGNRIEGALESGIENNGTRDCVCVGNIVTKVDDGMNLAGNGMGIYFGAQTGRANSIIGMNITAECQAGIWSETVHSIGSAVVMGNVNHANVAYGMGGAKVADAVWIGNVNVDNGQYQPPRGQDTAGMLFTADCNRMIVSGNIAVDGRDEDQRLQQSGLLMRGCDLVLNSNNIVDGSLIKNINSYANERVYWDNNLDGAELTITQP